MLIISFGPTSMVFPSNVNRHVPLITPGDLLVVMGVERHDVAVRHFGSGHHDLAVPSSLRTNLSLRRSDWI